MTRLGHWRHHPARCVEGTPAPSRVLVLRYHAPLRSLRWVMRRRQFLGFVGGASIAWPLTGHAQKTTLPVVGFLNSASADGYASMVRRPSLFSSTQILALPDASGPMSKRRRACS